LTGSKYEDQFSAFLTKKSMLIKDGRTDLNPLKKKITDHFFDAVQNSTLIRFSHLIRLGN